MIKMHQKSYRYAKVLHFALMLITVMSSWGLSVLGLVLTVAIRLTISIPLETRPNTVCLLSNHGYNESEELAAMQ